MVTMAFCNNGRSELDSYKAGCCDHACGVLEPYPCDATRASAASCNDGDGETSFSLDVGGDATTVSMASWNRVCEMLQW